MLFSNPNYLYIVSPQKTKKSYSWFFTFYRLFLRHSIYCSRKRMGWKATCHLIMILPRGGRHINKMSHQSDVQLRSLHRNINMPFTLKLDAYASLTDSFSSCFFLFSFGERTMTSGITSIITAFHRLFI